MWDQRSPRTILSWQPWLEECLGATPQASTAFCDWLTDGHWPLDLQEAGRAIHLSRASPDLVALCYETGLAAAAQWEACLSHSTSLIATQPVPLSDEKTRAIWLERLFLRANVLLEKGETQACEHLWQRLIEETILPGVAHHQIMAVKVAVERGSVLLNRGHFRACLETLQCLEACSPAVGTMVLSRGYAVFVIAALRCGEFALARHGLECCESVTLISDDAVHPGILRLRIKLAMTQEDYAEASRLIDQGTLSVQPWSKSSLLLQQERIRVALIQNRLEEAQHELAALETMQKDTGLSQGIMNLPEERIELALRSRQVDRALIIACDDQLHKAELRKDDRSRARILSLKANALCQLEQIDLALPLIDQAFQLARERGMLTDLVDITYHAAGIAFLAGNAAKLRYYLGYGEILTLELGLERRRIIFSYLRALAIRRQSRSLALFELLQSRAVAGEVAYFIEHYGMIAAHGFVTREWNGEERLLDEKQVRDMIWSSPAIYLFPAEGVLAFHNGKEVRSIQKKVGEYFLRACIALFRTKEGLTLEQFHYLGSKVRFHRLRHHGAVRVAVHRVRRTLLDIGLDLVHDRTTGTYHLPPSWRRYEIRVVEKQGETRVSAKQRTDLILEALERSGHMTTHQLCQAMAVTRQALHPLLKRLENSGAIRLVARGPQSRYEICKRG